MPFVMLMTKVCAQSEIRTNDTLHSIEAKDTLPSDLYLSDKQTIKHYQEILEKTNNQLSLWMNPYAIFIASLGVLFTILAIVVAFTIYRQGKEYKNLINESIKKHKIALDKLITENKLQLENSKANLDRMIEEYQLKLDSAEDKAKKAHILSFLRKLEEQKEFIDTKIREQKHSGSDKKDFLERTPIKNNTRFYVKIKLNSPVQAFTIYMGIIASDEKLYWLGFSGNTKSKPFKNQEEFTQHKIYNSEEIIINENIMDNFRKGFSSIDIHPKLVEKIRVRGDSMDLREIIFNYKIII